MSVVTVLAGCTAADAAPDPTGAPTGRYEPRPDLVTTDEVGIRDDFDMSIADTHAYWSDPGMFEDADSFEYTAPDPETVDNGGDRATGDYVLPTDDMAFGENGNGLGDIPEAQPFDPEGLADRTTGRLYVSKPDEGNFACSGTVVNSESGSVVLTAAHCLVGQAGQLASSAIFIPDDADRGGQEPYGRWSGVSMFIPDRFKEEAEYTEDGFMIGEGWSYDFAYVVMEEQEGATVQDAVGGMGIAFGVATKTLVSTGYPAVGRYDGTVKYHCATTSWEYGSRGDYRWPCTMNSGSSGGGVFAFYDSDRASGYTVAVNSGSSADGTSSSAVLGEIAQRLYVSAGGWGNA